MQTIEMRALRAATVKPIGECGQPKPVSSGTREKRTMFAYVRLCSPMFAYVRLIGKKLLRARRAHWGMQNARIDNDARPVWSERHSSQTGPTEAF